MKPTLELQKPFSKNTVKVLSLLKQHGKKMSQALLHKSYTILELEAAETKRRASLQKALDELDAIQNAKPRRVPVMLLKKRMIKSEQSTKKQEKESDNRPYSPYTWGVRHIDGTTTMYHLSQNGSLSTQVIGKYKIRMTKDYNPVKHPEMPKEIHEAATRDHEAKLRELEDTKEKSQEIQKSEQPRQPWGQPRRLWNPDGGSQQAATISAPPPTPHPDLAGNLRATQNQERYSGFQIAAIKAGLSPTTPNLESMSFDEMKAMAANRQVAATEDARRAVGINYDPSTKQTTTRPR